MLGAIPDRGMATGYRNAECSQDRAAMSANFDGPCSRKSTALRMIDVCGTGTAAGCGAHGHPQPSSDGAVQHRYRPRPDPQRSDRQTHVTRIFTKLVLRDRAQAVVLAYETRLVTPGNPTERGPDHQSAR